MPISTRRSLVARVPSDRLGEFSYATEHVTHDGAVGALLACTRALERAKEHLEGPWGRCLRWINDRLGEVCTMRRPYPGLGVGTLRFRSRQRGLSGSAH